ncbi:MAG: WYL domain-containing protein, partial [Bacillota bacterium]
DRFGKDTVTYRIDDNNFMAVLKVELSPPFWGWIFQFGDKVKIISPENVVEDFIKHIEEVKHNYEG